MFYQKVQSSRTALQISASELDVMVKTRTVPLWMLYAWRSATSKNIAPHVTQYCYLSTENRGGRGPDLALTYIQTRVSISDDFGNLPLHLACRNGHFKITYYMIPEGEPNTLVYLFLSTVYGLGWYHHNCWLSSSKFRVSSHFRAILRIIEK